MAAQSDPLFAPTGANQYTDQSYALPSVGAPNSTLGPKTGFEMFSSPAAVSPATGASPVGAPATPPGVVPPANQPINTTGPQVNPKSGTGPFDPSNPTGQLGGVLNAGSGNATVQSLYPGFTNQFYNWLQSQMGQGATPFNLSAIMPSSGQATTPGSLSAPLTDINQMLESFYKTGTGGPAGTSTLESMAQTGNPTDVGPAWQAMLAAEQQNTDRNAANLREQFAFGGNLKSSPFAGAMDQFYQQNTLNQNAQLTAAEQQAQEAAAGRQLTAGQDLTQGATSMGQELQGLDQQAIQNMLAEFIRTRPEYSPLLGAEGGAATTFPPTISGNVGVGGMGGAISSAGTALSGIADLWSSLSKSSSGGLNAGSTGISPNVG